MEHLAKLHGQFVIRNCYWATTVLALSVLLLFSACSKQEPTVYESKAPEPEQAAPPSPQLPDGHPQLALPDGHPPISGSVSMVGATLPTEFVGQGDLPQWILPSDWEATAPKPMRRANFQVADTGMELAVTSFPGDVGGMAANVNRWRAQLGLAPAANTDIPNYVTERDVAGQRFFIVDLLGPAKSDGSAPERMLTAVTQHNGNSWFFKLSGPAPAVEAAKPAFEAFVDSIRF